MYFLSIKMKEHLRIMFIIVLNLYFIFILIHYYNCFLIFFFTAQYILEVFEKLSSFLRWII